MASKNENEQPPVIGLPIKRETGFAPNVTINLMESQQPPVDPAPEKRETGFAPTR